MCGIAGVVSKKTGVGGLSSLQDMLSRLVHRGPDGEGSYCDERVAMGMRRLSIIDLEGGWQPLYNEDRSLVLIMNGEIYNYVELTADLKAKGHIFATGSDAEVILHLYEERREDALHALRGMFAFALLDLRRNQVFIARDRMGEKPLYLYEDADAVVFASEMKSLLACGRVPFELDPASVNDFFHYQYVPEPRTPLKHVRKLPRAHYLKVDLATGSVTQTKYWDMLEVEPIEGDPAELVRAELDDVCRLLIRADVPVGVALSGGLDSSAIAALAAKKYPGVMHAFSVGYPGRPANDERSAALELADLLGMPFHEIELTTADLVQDFERMNASRDDPIADISGYGYFSVSRAARAHGVPVLLQGQGGDELFWGYEWVKDAAAATHEMPLERQVRGGMLDAIRAWFGATSPTGHKPHLHRPVFHELAPDFRMALSGARDVYTDRFIAELGDASAFDLFTFPERWPAGDLLITRLICDTYLLENGIAQGDRLSMANSVELRLPFVDYKLVELVIGLRKAHRSRPDFAEFPKPWLRGAMKGVLPDHIIDRRKQGFAPPTMEWHRAIFERYGHHLDGGYLVEAKVLSPEAAADLSKGPFPRGAIAPMSFKALVLELWCRSMTQAASL